jgi:hypothetical protein
MIHIGVGETMHTSGHILHKKMVHKQVTKNAHYYYVSSQNNGVAK